MARDGRRRARVVGRLDDVSIDTPEALGEVYRVYWPLVYRRCLATLGDPEEARDATQDAFLIFLRNFEAGREDVLRNLLRHARVCSKVRRDRRDQIELVGYDGEIPPALSVDPADVVETRELLAAVTRELRPTYRRYLADKFAGYGRDEMASRLGRARKTSGKSLVRAHQQARRIRDAFMRLGAWASVVTGDAVNRLHSRFRRVRGADQGVMATTVTPGWLSVSAMAVAASVLLSGDGFTAHPSGPPGSPRPPAGSLAQEGGASQPAPLAVSAPRHEDTTPPNGHISTFAPAVPTALPRLPLPSLLGGGSHHDTPEDTLLLGATPAPRYSENHTIVAIGIGYQCNCSLLYRSTDGGATWDNTPGPVMGGTQIALPPTYPDDARIFIGNPVNSPAPDVMAAAWGKPYSPLPVPPGQIALAAGFDAGDMRAVVVTEEGVVSYDLQTHLVQTLIVNPTPVETGSVATAFGDPATAVLLVTPPGVSGPDPNTASSILWDPGWSVYACPASGCHRLSMLPGGGAAELAVSPMFGSDHTLVAFTIDRVFLSRDGGTTFATVGSASGDEVLLSVSLAPSRIGGIVLWADISSRQRWYVRRWHSGAPGWADASSGDPSLNSFGILVVVTGDRVLDVLRGRGFRCTGTGGAAWGARCPPER